MPSKETGAVYIVKCPTCGDELVVGWLRGEIPIFDKDKINKREIKQKVSKADANGLSNEKVICSCANAVMAEFDKTKGRVVVEWATDEPAVGNINLH